MWAKTSTRLSAQAFCALVLLHFFGCGGKSSQAPEPVTQAEPQAEQPVARPSTAAAAPAPKDKTADQIVDWAKFTKPGDVTQEILPYIHNRTLDFGNSRISTSPEVTLVKAEIEQGKLLLTLRMNKPEQRVLFEGMQGKLGAYRPKGRGVRPVTISKASHAERFVMAGVLQFGVDHPHPEKIQVARSKPPTQAETFQQAAEMMREVHKREAEERARMIAKAQAAEKQKPKQTEKELLPGPETGYTPRSLDFAKLAVAVSALYKMPGRDTFRPEGKAKMDAAKAAAAYPNPKLQQYANKIIERVKADQNINVQAVRQQLIASADRLADQKLGYGTVKGSYTDSDGSTRNVFANGSEPDPDAQREANQLYDIANGSDEEIREYVKGQRNQNTLFDLFAGDGISNRLEDLHENILIEAYKILPAEAKAAAGPKSASCLISLSRPDPSTIKFRNVSGKRLTDVVVDLSWGFTRSDKLKSYGHAQFVFIPVWKPNEEVELQKVQLREPSVMHAKVNIYANEASSKDHAFALVDPSNRPNNNPGKIVLAEHRGFGAIGKPEFSGEAWAEVDGKRYEWKNVKTPLEISVEPGQYKIVVHAKEKRQRTRTVHEGTITVDGGQRESISITLYQ